MTNTGGTPAGWYHAPGDAEGTQRYWDGSQWIGEPQPVPQQAPPPPAQPTPPPPAGPAPGSPPPFQQAPPPGGAPPGYVAYGGAGAAPATGDLAEPWKRIVARLIDAIIVGVAGFIVAVVIAVALDNFVGGFIAGLIGIGIGVGYEVGLTVSMGATFGKQVFKMKIVNADGTAVDQQVMIKRYMPSIVIGVIGLVPILGLLTIPLSLALVIMSLVWIFTDDRRRSVYDRFGDTLVKATD